MGMDLWDFFPIVKEQMLLLLGQGNIMYAEIFAQQYLVSRMFILYSLQVTHRYIFCVDIASGYLVTKQP